MAGRLMDRRTLAALGLLLILAACGGGGSAASTPSAHGLIIQAQAAIARVTSYHFKLVVDNPGAGTPLVIQTAEGDILVPDKLQARANVLVLGNVVQEQIITIGSKQYITDPITSAWMHTSGLLDARTLSDSNTGVISTLGHIQNPSTPSDANIDGTPCWSIGGQIDAKDLAGITGGGAPAGAKDAVTICIGKANNLTYQVKLAGIAALGDSKQTIRTFKLSKFNENVTIAAPMP
jgi:hypothetical protein